MRSWLQIAADTAIDAKRGLERWWAIRRQQLRMWWIRRRGRTTPAYISGTASATSSAHATLTVQRQRVDRETVSDREWLASLDDRVEAIFELMDHGERNRTAEHEDVNRRLAVQRAELRAEIGRQTRQGWELILAGLAWLALGTGLGILG